MTTLDQLAATLPNGFHDALVSSCTVDFVRRTVEFELSVWVGDLDAPDEAGREEYRPAKLLLDGVAFVHIEPPDPSYPYAVPDAVRVDLCATDPNHPLANRLPADAFFSRFFINEWNAFVHIAAKSAALTWVDTDDATAGPDALP